MIPSAPGVDGGFPGNYAPGFPIRHARDSVKDADVSPDPGPQPLSRRDSAGNGLFDYLYPGGGPPCDHKGGAPGPALRTVSAILIS